MQDQMTKKKFKKIFYVVQTKPVLKTCGYTFNPKVAAHMAKKVGELTGVKGKIIEFTRDELDNLAFNKK